MKKKWGIFIRSPFLGLGIWGEGIQIEAQLSRQAGLKGLPMSIGAPTEFLREPTSARAITHRITKSVSDANTWFEWDIKTLLTEWVGTPSSNYGMMVKFQDDGTAQTSNRYFNVFSSDYVTDPAKRPILRVRYTFPDVTIYYVRDASGNVIATYKK